MSPMGRRFRPSSLRARERRYGWRCNARTAAHGSRTSALTAATLPACRSRRVQPPEPDHPVDAGKLLVVDEGLESRASRQAAIQMSDAPTDGATNVVAAFQTNTVFVRFIATFIGRSSLMTQWRSPRFPNSRGAQANADGDDEV